MTILGDFEEFEGSVPEPPYPYHHSFDKFLCTYEEKELLRFK